MVSKASQTVLLQQYCVLLSEFPNVIFHSSVEKSSMMMMISAKDTWCGGGGGAKLNSEIKANVLSPLHYVQVMCNHVQLPKILWTRRMIEQGWGERWWPLLHLLEVLEIATLIQTHSNPWIVSRRKVGIASLVAMICLVPRENRWRMHTAAGQIQKSVEETGEEFMQLIRPIWISGSNRNANSQKCKLYRDFKHKERHRRYFGLTTWWEQALDRSSRDGCCTGTLGLHINLTQNRWRLARHVKAGGNVRRPNWAFSDNWFQQDSMHNSSQVCFCSISLNACPNCTSLLVVHMNMNVYVSVVAIEEAKQIHEQIIIKSGCDSDDFVE